MTFDRKPSRRLFKFGLRTLLFVMVVAAVLSATLGRRAMYVAGQRNALRALGRFSCARFQLDTHGGVLSRVSLARRLLGEKFFIDVVMVSLVYEQQLSDNDLEHVAKLNYLKRLDLELTDISDDGIQLLRGLTRLKHLELGSTRVTGEGLKQLTPLTELKSLGLGFTEIDDDALASLVQTWPALEWLDLTSTPITDAVIGHLVTCQQLGVLILTDTAITPKAVEHLEQLRNLRVVVLTNTATNDEALAAISRLPSLEELHLRSTDITDEGMQHLAGTVRLKTLQISGTSVTDIGLAHLSGLTQLRSLDIRGLDVSNDGLASISELPFETLLVQNTRITADGLLHVVDLTADERNGYMDKLRLIDSTGRSKAAQRELQHSLLKGVKDMPTLLLEPDAQLGSLER